MPLIVNGQAIPLPDPPTLAALLLELAPEPPYAIAHNEEFLPKTEYALDRLNDGDRIEIVHPSAGG